MPIRPAKLTAILTAAVLLARVLLRERLVRVQAAGVCLALAGVALIAA